MQPVKSLKCQLSYVRRIHLSLRNKGQLGSEISIKRGEVEFSPGFQVQNANGLFAGG